MRETFSQRQRRHERATDLSRELPPECVERIIQLWRNTIGEAKDLRRGLRPIGPNRSKLIYDRVVRRLREAWGVEWLSITGGILKDPEHEVHSFLRESCHLPSRDPLSPEEEEERLLRRDRKVDVIEVMMQVVMRHRDLNANDIIERLNYRFDQDSLAYWFEPDPGIIVLRDSEVIHDAVIAPILRLLHNPRFKSAEDEFAAALRHHRAGDARAALTSAAAAMESVIKVICNDRGWETYPKEGRPPPPVQTMTMGHLAAMIKHHRLLAASTQSTVDALVTLLKKAMGPRNSEAAHGHGSEPREVPQHLAEFGISQVASCIRFLVASDDELPA